MSAETLGSLTLSDVATDVLIGNEFGGHFIDSGTHIPHQDGIRLDPQAPYSPRVLVLKTVLRYTNSSGTITHVDGAAGHLRENAHLIHLELAGPGEVALTRTVPHLGDVRAMVRLLDDPAPMDARHAIGWTLTVPSGSWQDATETSEATSSVTTSGNRRIWDPIVVFASAGTITHTAADGTVTSITAASGPTYPVTVDVGAKTVTDNTAADVRGDVTFTQPWWLRMDPDGAQSFTGTATIKYRNRWA